MFIFHERAMDGKSIQIGGIGTLLFGIYMVILAGVFVSEGSPALGPILVYLSIPIALLGIILTAIGTY
ncbi:hypothetical protein V5735_01870 (plasmid) [Haladaptatus sp. SPP-AMP-3]|uniref:hypothetical protein n=1 Tax=Haladaptatus sp. SPP-AMP-3 TaxID=3121295 RepID=UPI003C309148